MALLKTLILKEIIVALMIINAITYTPLSLLFQTPLHSPFNLFSLSISAFKCENEAIFALKRVKNPEKTLKFGSKTKLNAMGERSLWGVGVAVGMAVG